MITLDVGANGRAERQRIERGATYGVGVLIDDLEAARALGDGAAANKVRVGLPETLWDVSRGTRREALGRDMFIRSRYKNGDARENECVVS